MMSRSLLARRGKDHLVVAQHAEDLFAAAGHHHLALVGLQSDGDLSGAGAAAP